MALPTSSPRPRDGLDEGSLAELAQSCREIDVEQPPKRAPRVPATFGPIDVPAEAPALVDGLPAYGAC